MIVSDEWGQAIFLFCLHSSDRIIQANGVRRFFFFVFIRLTSFVWQNHSGESSSLESINVSMNHLQVCFCILSVCLFSPDGWAEQSEPFKCKPSAVLSFLKESARYVKDATGRGHHAVINGKASFAEGLTGHAFEFNGRSFLRVRGHPELYAKDQLTLDAWVWVESFGGDYQTIVSQAGEHYRLHLEPNGRPSFGLKGFGKRGDLTGGKLKPKAWHRITGVFRRPQMDLYLDGKKVASKKWDFPIAESGDLFVGSKSGVVSFFRGRIDSVRMYPCARPPEPNDLKNYLPETMSNEKPSISLKTLEDVIRISSVELDIDIDKTTGAIRRAKRGDKLLVNDNQRPPFTAELLESDSWDGISDLAEGKFIKAEHRLKKIETKHDEKSAEVRVDSRLAFPGNDAFDIRMVYRLNAGGKHLQQTLAVRKEGPFKNRFLRRLSLNQPLTLNHRKRIVQGGDQGRTLDTRYQYQFHVNTVGGLLHDPERNEWRFLSLDQNSPFDFRIWKSESDRTASLTLQRGRRSAGWTSVYDREGGVMAAYRGMARRAPKSISVDAAGTGEFSIHLHPPTQPALDLDSSRAETSLFGDEHVMDWIFYEDEFSFAEPERELADIWSVKNLPSDSAVKPAPQREPDYLRKIPIAEGELEPFVQGGVPLPRGSIQRSDQLRIFDGERELPLQSRTLAHWPDGTIKWLFLVFPLSESKKVKMTPGTGDGQRLPIQITTRNNQAKSLQLRFGEQVQSAKTESAISVSEADGVVSIDTGSLQVTLGKGQQWIKEILIQKKPIHGSQKDGRLSFIDMLRPESGYVTNRSHPSGKRDDGPLEIQSIQVEEKGPLRAIVRLEGMTRNIEPQRVILRVELYGGKPFIRLFHTVEFLYKDPRRAFVRNMGLRLPLQLDPENCQVSAGTEAGPSEAANGREVGLLQTSQHHYRAWQKTETPEDTLHAGGRSRGWLTLSDGKRGVTAMLRNMWQEFPKELRANSDDPSITIGLWPDSVPLMDVRRYSNYPHRSQGESVSDRNDWVERSYYPNDPFVGVSKTHEMLLVFHGEPPEPAAIDSLAADFQSPPLIYAGASWYSDVGVTFPFTSPHRNLSQADTALEKVIDFWLFHQRLHGWYGMWDYGDFQHMFRNGYGWVYSRKDLAEILKQPADKRYAFSRTKRRILDYSTYHDWAHDNGRWGWTNSEGLPGLLLQLQYMRTGRRDIFFAAEAMARHVRDVDIRHDGMWFGRGTRHGVQHWSDGNHEERQTIHSEFRFIHYLTGDLRSRDVAQKLTDRIYTKGKIRIHAAHSGRLYGLLTRWEMTGDKKLGEMLRRYVHCFIVPEGIAESPSVEFPMAATYDKPENINSGGMFFNCFGAMHTLLEYYYLTEDRELRDAIIRMADEAIRRKTKPGLLRKSLAFASKHADDPAPYRTSLQQYLGQGVWRYYFQSVSNNPEHWTGDTSFLVGSVPGSLFWLNDMFYLMTAIERDPDLNNSQRDYLRERNESGQMRHPTRASWQDEYDAPEFEEYLRREK